MTDSAASSYLQDLTLRLALGASGLETPLARLHGDWLVGQQRKDGGFAGREGESDPYYTAFALRGLWILGRLDRPIAENAGRFLRGRMVRREGVVDLISLIFAAAICELSAGVVVIEDEDREWQNRVAELLASLRTDDGGFAKTPEGRAGSTYQTFLSVLCHELLDTDIQDPERVVKFLESQAHSDGGYLEIRAAKRPGVNPTAAAVGTLKTLGRLADCEADSVVAFLCDQQSDEGGLAANTRIPFADLLSTCTGMITMTDLSPFASSDSFGGLSVERIRQYALSMQDANGGFHGFALDQTADVEYTFYGLATLALIQLVDSAPMTDN
ncbi:MAG: prenyltransferase/squalene oxidase repeat-containing protein [Planctomycetota bacterium]